MKNTAFNKAMIYDDNCPLCMAYTKAFIKTGLLKKENRISFTEVNMQQFKIDWQKAKHEIPLVDIKTGEVKYGVDALVDVLSQKIFCIKPLMQIKPVDSFFRKLYKLISYNRKIIVAKKVVIKSSFDCTPDYSFFWRWMLITVCYLLCNYFLLNITTNIIHTYHLTISKYIVLCWMIIPTTISLFYKKRMATDIHAHVSISMLIASFMLLILQCLANYFSVSIVSLGFLYAFVFVVFLKQLKMRNEFMKNNQ